MYTFLSYLERSHKMLPITANWSFLLRHSLATRYSAPGVDHFTAATMEHIKTKPGKGVQWIDASRDSTCRCLPRFLRYNWSVYREMMPCLRRLLVMWHKIRIVYRCSAGVRNETAIWEQSLRFRRFYSIKNWTRTSTCPEESLDFIGQCRKEVVLTFLSEIMQIVLIQTM